MAKELYDSSDQNQPSLIAKVEMVITTTKKKEEEEKKEFVFISTNSKFSVL